MLMLLLPLLLYAMPDAADIAAADACLNAAYAIRACCLMLMFAVAAAAMLACYADMLPFFYFSLMISSPCRRAEALPALRQPPARYMPRHVCLMLERYAAALRRARYAGRRHADAAAGACCHAVYARY